MNDKPRLAEILGVEVEQRFHIKGETGYFTIDDDGVMWSSYTNLPSTSGIYVAIRDPASILRGLTEKEVEICEALDARWATKKTDALYVELWRKKPIERFDESGNVDFVTKSGNYPVAGVRADLFPSVGEGECIEVAGDN